MVWVSSLSVCPSLHRPTGTRVCPREQHCRRPASKDRLWWRRGTEGFCEPWRTLLPERKCLDGEEGTRLWGALSRSNLNCIHISIFLQDTLVKDVFHHCVPLLTRLYHPSVCVQQSLSTTALMVWVQCSRAGSRSVSKTTQHHKLDAEGMECFPHPGDLFHTYDLLFVSFNTNHSNSVWACGLQMKNLHFTSWTCGMLGLESPFSSSSANELSLKANNANIATVSWWQFSGERVCWGPGGKHQRQPTKLCPEPLCAGGEWGKSLHSSNPEKCNIHFMNLQFKNYWQTNWNRWHFWTFCLCLCASGWGSKWVYRRNVMWWDVMSPCAAHSSQHQRWTDWSHRHWFWAAVLSFGVSDSKTISNFSVVKFIFNPLFQVLL